MTTVVMVDIDLGIGRQYGYHHPTRTAQLRPKPPGARPANCHPDRPMHAHGKCRYCYDRGRRSAQ